MAAVLDGQFVKKILTASRKDTSGIILALNYSEVLQNCHFHLFAMVILDCPVA